MNLVIDPPVPTLVPVVGGGAFPVGRVFCIGQNYAAHAREMGQEPDPEKTFFFTAWSQCVVPDGGVIAYPPGTENYHYEVELVLALGLGGADIPVASALDCVFGYAVGLDMTRRDIQAAAKAGGRPWDAAKNVEQSKPVGAIHPAAGFDPDRGRIALTLNGEIRQDGDLSDQIASPARLIAFLSTLYTLQPGDLIFTGTPSGVGAVRPGDRLVGSIEGLPDLTVTIGEASA